MKKIFILLFSLIFHFSCFAQSFPTSNAIWNESIHINDISAEILFGLLGDTMINNTTYNKLYRLSDTLLLEENVQHYIGALRNEKQKVFFRPTNWTHPDILLYDFAAEVGDTVWHNAAFYYDNLHDNLYDYYYLTIVPAPHYSVIASIEIINNIKTYYTTVPKTYFLLHFDLYYNIWHEGIGSFRGLFLPLLSDIKIPLCNPINNLKFNLSCFKHNDTVKFLYSACSKCFCSSVNVNIKENSYDEIINIFPNPTDNILNINIPENLKIKSIIIYSMEGKPIKENKYVFNSKQLNISELTTGCYIVNIETDKGNFKKLIIKN